MSQTINRMYGSYEDAKAAFAELAKNRYKDIHLVGYGTDAAAPAIDDIVASIMSGYVVRAEAKIYAQGVQKGGSLVTVHAPFGTARKALWIMDKYGPIESGIPDTVFASRSWDEATPISSALNVPVLLDDTASFSAFWNLPLLMTKPYVPKFTQSANPFSSIFGMPVLSKNATIFSSFLRLPVLAKDRSIES
jgi:hypothetical protein